MPQLPHGRGYRKGPDNYIAQQESFDRRRRELSNQQGWALSAVDNSFYGRITDATASRDVVKFLDLPLLDRDYTLTQAFLGVLTGIASTTLSSGIYIYQSDPDASLTLIAGTNVTFQTSTPNERKEATLAREVTLQRDVKYFMGSVATGGASDATVSTAASTGSSFYPILRQTASVLPNRVKMSDLTQLFGNSVPCVMYVSVEAARFF